MAGSHPQLVVSGQRDMARRAVQRPSPKRAPGWSWRTRSGGAGEGGGGRRGRGAAGGERAADRRLRLLLGVPPPDRCLVVVEPPGWLAWYSMWPEGPDGGWGVWKSMILVIDFQSCWLIFFKKKWKVQGHRLLFRQVFVVQHQILSFDFHGKFFWTLAPKCVHPTPMHGRRHLGIPSGIWG